MELGILLTGVCLSLISSCSGQTYNQPEQIHINYGVDPTVMTVTWVTFSDTPVSIAEYGEAMLSKVAKGVSDKFIDGGAMKRIIFMHRVNMTGLTPGKQYRYHVGSPDGWSAVYNFYAMSDSSKWQPKFAVFGDFGSSNAQSLGRLQKETQEGHFDFAVHVGDLAYNLHTYDATVGDQFMRQMEPIAAYLPYMTCVGNHEWAYNFSNYKYRFSMPAAGGDGQNMYFSYDVGPIHFIAWANELYYYTYYGIEQIFNQYKWLENDLKKANLPENRAKHPWIIVYGHRPMYCSNSDDGQHCINLNNTCRVGYKEGGWKSPEDLFYNYGVDVMLSAHEHSYERCFPVYNLTVCNGTGSNPYNNPDAPVHIITGSAGCSEGTDPFEPKPWPWSAFHSDDYGYNRFQVFNSTHLYIEYVSDIKDGAVIDKMWLIKDKHGPYLYNCHKKQRPYPIPPEMMDKELILKYTKRRRFHHRDTGNQKFDDIADLLEFKNIN
ncbi:acid phosphatase type 7-like [Lineus longissimus]|uniref:acid phosphatase type 7-like n=1 Tax=Lineus longissimus TaxID=88925 RepID=UPI002B4DDC26